MRTLTALVAVLFFLGACEAAGDPAPEAARRNEESPRREQAGMRAQRKQSPARERAADESRPARAGDPTPLRDPPPPDRRIPATAAAVAEHLRLTHLRLMRAVEEWIDEGTLTGTPTAREVSLWALYQQRIYRHLAGHPVESRAVEAQLPSWLRVEQRLNLGAMSRLAAIVEPIKPPIPLETTPPTPPTRLRPIYDKAARIFNIRWEVLASVNFVESRFGRLLGPSTAGAMGPMQFLPSTWSAYGAGGDIMDPHDAVLGAARYLQASGAPANLRGALYAYNRSYNYVDAIQNYARQMIRDPRYFYVYYYWQVFVATTRGDVQMTGPGADVRNPRR